MFSFENIVNDIIANITGPLSFRFIMQPAVAVLLAIRDGRTDAKLNRKPFLVNIILNKSQRNFHILNALHSILTSIIVGIVTDAIAQHMIFGHVRIISALFVGTIIISLPYVITRGLTNRIYLMIYRKQT